MEFFCKEVRKLQSSKIDCKIPGTKNAIMLYPSYTLFEFSSLNLLYF